MRRAELTDAHFVSASQINMASESEGLQLNPATVQAGVDSVFSDPHRGEYWIVEKTVAGTTSPVACLLIQREWSDWRNGWFHWIHSLYVIPEVRRTGVCRWMLRVVQENARTAGALGLRLYVEKSNSTAQKTYLNFGLKGEHYDLLELEF
jgi:GNAT superfamily N-acetyltransferase